MSELSDLTNAGRAGAIPGYTLHRLSNTAIGEVEDHLQRWYIERVALATFNLDAATQREVVARAAEDAAFAYVYDTAAFRRKLQSAEGRQLTIQASIGMRVPKLNLADVREKVDAIPPAELARIVDWCWHRDPPSGDDQGKTGGPPGDGTGGK